MQSSILFGLILMLKKAGFTGLTGAATTFTTANAVDYAIGGKAYTKAAVAGGATPTTDAVTGLPITLNATAAQGKGTVVVWCLDAAGNIKVIQGTTELLDAAGNFASAAPQFPAMIDTLCPFAYSVHKSIAAERPHGPLHRGRRRDRAAEHAL